MKFKIIEILICFLMFISQRPGMAQSVVATSLSGTTSSSTPTQVPSVTVTGSQTRREKEKNQSDSAVNQRFFPCPLNFSKEEFENLALSQIEKELTPDEGGKLSPDFKWIKGKINSDHVFIVRVDLGDRAWLGACCGGERPSQVWYYFVCKVNAGYVLQRIMISDEKSDGYWVFVKKADLKKMHLDLVFVEGKRSTYFHFTRNKLINDAFGFYSEKFDPKKAKDFHSGESNVLSFPDAESVRITNTKYVCEKPVLSKSLGWRLGFNDGGDCVSFVSEDDYRWDDQKEIYTWKTPRTKTKNVFSAGDLISREGDATSEKKTGFLKVLAPSSFTESGQQSFEISQDTQNPVVETTEYLPINYNLKFKFAFRKGTPTPVAAGKPVDPNSPGFGVVNKGVTTNFYVVTGEPPKRFEADGFVFALNDTEEITTEKPPAFDVRVGSVDEEGYQWSTVFFSGHFGSIWNDMLNAMTGEKDMHPDDSWSPWGDGKEDNWLDVIIQKSWRGIDVEIVGDKGGEFCRSIRYPGKASVYGKFNTPMKLLLWGRGGRTAFRDFSIETPNYGDGSSY